MIKNQFKRLEAQCVTHLFAGSFVRILSVYVVQMSNYPMFCEFVGQENYSRVVEYKHVRITHRKAESMEKVQAVDT